MRRGWCPGVFAPMPSGDGLLVRVKPPLGRATAVQLRCLAEASRVYGNGGIGLTGRGNFLVRGLAAAGVEGFAAAMVGCGLACADPVREARRRVDRLAAGGEAGAAVEAALLGAEGLDALPAKFSVYVGLGGEADILVRDGFVGIAGADLVAPAADPGAAVVRLVRVFLRLRGTRMRALVAEFGATGIYELARLRATEKLRETHASGLGLIGPAMVAAMAPSGDLDAEVLPILADISERFGDGVVRTAPWRALVFGGVGDLLGLLTKLADAGLIVDDADPRRLVTACVGQPRCGQASVDTRRDAALLPASGRLVHVSGCAKGCAHPGAADFTLVGRDGLYDLVVGGRAGDRPVARSLLPGEAAAWLAA